ncbi:MAG: hypothetical protein HYS81_01695 [Candidatus Aenigmatarchaeota archaeon]|nr:MAG: hypothetical protein HYS81_01695 [Candidatus Aenigmarchaeota archaeon]
MRSKKGIELPVNMLVMLAVAVVVLLVVIAWFVSTSSSTTRTQTEQQQFQSCCSKFVTAGCPTGSATTFPTTGACGYNDANSNGVQDAGEGSATLGTLGAKVGISGDSGIRSACGCQATTGTSLAACGDGADNDGDGAIDTNDPGCSSASDTSEISQCADGIDNDADTKTDFGAANTTDPQCSSLADNSEAS